MDHEEWKMDKPRWKKCYQDSNRYHTPLWSVNAIHAAFMHAILFRIHIYRAHSCSVFAYLGEKNEIPLTAQQNCWPNVSSTWCTSTSAGALFDEVYRNRISNNSFPGIHLRIQDSHGGLRCPKFTPRCFASESPSTSQIKLADRYIALATKNLGHLDMFSGVANMQRSFCSELSRTNGNEELHRYVDQASSD